MIVPDYWAEAHHQYRSKGKQVTVRRYGWSMVSEAEALAMAETRVADALQRILSGDKIDRRERKVAYNGASGVPIREEVLARHGEEVITRNAYGAHCLNSPRALFADIDFATTTGARPIVLVFAALVSLAVVAGWLMDRWSLVPALLLSSLLLAYPMATLGARIIIGIRGGTANIARRRLSKFVAKNPSWNLRLYRTPAGFRLLATHQPFDATALEVQKFFAAVGADPVYVRMCANQRCFRARLTAKPWRIGIADHLRPRPGVWPVQPDKLAIRRQWIEKYEKIAADYAACRYVESLGSGVIHPEIKAVVNLHDRESRAGSLGGALA